MPPFDHSSPLQVVQDGSLTDEEEAFNSQLIPDNQPTQINEDAPDLTPSLSSENPATQPWAILHSLSPLVPTVKLMPEINNFGLGRHKGPLPSNAPFKVNLAIGTEKEDCPEDALLQISRFHALIQRKGLDDQSDELLPPPTPSLDQNLTRRDTLPNNGHNGKIVISIWDQSANGTFVNGKKCTPFKWSKLEHGDEIALGSKPGKVQKADKYFVWLVSIPSQPKFPMNKLPTHQSDICKQIYDRYDFLVPMGKGAFATTWKAFDRETGEYRAIKVIKKNEHMDNPQDLLNFKREIAILAKIDHPNIVKFHDALEDDDLIWIVLELVDGGEYLDYVCNANGLDEQSCRLITRMLLSAIHYLAGLKIAHRDLKPENILMTSGKNPQAKIADFGLAKQLSSQSTEFRSHCGTPAYVAPEVVVPYRKATGYTVAVDMYSLGVIIYASLANCSPFEGQANKGDFKEVCQQRKVDVHVLARMRPNISKVALQFISSLTTKNVEKRLTAAQALEHAWIAGLGKRSTDPKTRLPDNPVQTATQQPRNELKSPSKSAEPIPEDGSNPSTMRCRRILAPNDLNVDMAPRQAADSGVSSFFEPTTQKMSWPGAGAKTSTPRDRLVTMSPSSMHHADVAISPDIDGVDDESDMNEVVCSQKLENMQLKTPQRSSYNHNLIADEVSNEPPREHQRGRSRSSTPGQLNTALPESDPVMEVRSASKRKLRQWSTSPHLKVHKADEVGPNARAIDEDVIKPDEPIPSKMNLPSSSHAKATAQRPEAPSPRKSKRIPGAARFGKPDAEGQKSKKCDDEHVPSQDPGLQSSKRKRRVPR